MRNKTWQCDPAGHSANRLVGHQVGIEEASGGGHLGLVAGQWGKKRGLVSRWGRKKGLVSQWDKKRGLISLE